MPRYTPEDHTFVICAYKENAYLDECAASILAQTLKSHVLISTSTPNDSISSVANKYGIEVVVNPHPHLAGDDWNFGYNSAQTKLVTIVHQDDYYEPNFLERTLEVFNGYSDDVIIAFSDYFELRNGERIYDNKIMKVKRKLNAPLAKKGLNKSKFVRRRMLGLGCAICCPAVTLNKELLGNDVFDTTLKNSCDYKTWVDISTADGRFVYFGDQLVGHRIYAESATTRNIAENVRKKDDQIIFEMLWPKFIATAINNLYSTSESSNEL